VYEVFWNVLSRKINFKIYSEDRFQNVFPKTIFQKLVVEKYFKKYFKKPSPKTYFGKVFQETKRKKKCFRENTLLKIFRNSLSGRKKKLRRETPTLFAIPHQHHPKSTTNHPKYSLKPPQHTPTPCTLQSKQSNPIILIHIKPSTINITTYLHHPNTK